MCVSEGDGWRGGEAARTPKVVTLETFHASRGWLKADAPWKVAALGKANGKQKRGTACVSEGMGGERMRGGAYV